LSFLAKPDTLAVVTGQQAGIFGGPLYTFDKALSAVQLARELTASLLCNVVPVFWQETEDHDLAESAHYGILDKENNFVDAIYDITSTEDLRRRPVSTLPLQS